MPKGPRGEKRPADVIGGAVVVGKIATGEMTEELSMLSGRTRSGKAGAEARSKALSAAERSEIAKNAAKTRWTKEANMTEAITACESVEAIYAEKKASGLVDVKFYVGNISEAAREVVCEEVLNLERAIEAGDYSPLIFNDRHDG